MVIVDAYGATASKLIFAMLGAMAAVQPTFKASLEACIAQIVGVVFGALAAMTISVFSAAAAAAIWPRAPKGRC